MNEEGIAHKKERKEVKSQVATVFKHHNTKVYGGVEVWLHVCLMWVDLEAGVDVFEKRQTSCHPCRE